jgi:hypothetical protein
MTVQQVKNDIDDSIKQAFNQTYENIGFDIGGENNTITRDDLFDICLDLVDVLGDMTTEAKEYWGMLSLDEKIAYKTIVFEYELYEVQGVLG